MKTVGIIGGTGFLGSHITKRFLLEGYKVKVSVTDIRKIEKYNHLFNLEYSDNLNNSALKVEDLEPLKDFISGCEIIIHGGTPFQLEVEDPQSELFDPTIKGAENFLKAIQQYPQIKKIVFIASVAAWNTNFPLPAGNKKNLDSFDENDGKFTSLESHPFAQEKFIANKIVEEFVTDHPYIPFEITSISPVMVMGKSLSTREDSTSTGIQFLFKNKIAPNSFIQMFYDNDILMAIVDVEDVAIAIFKAATISGMHGKNYLLSSESYPVSDLSLMLTYKMPVNTAHIIFKNQLAINDLHIKFKPVKETLNKYNLN